MGEGACARKVPAKRPGPIHQCRGRGGVGCPSQYGFVMLWMNVATFSLQCCATCIAGTVAALDHF